MVRNPEDWARPYALHSLDGILSCHHRAGLICGIHESIQASCTTDNDGAPRSILYCIEYNKETIDHEMAQSPVHDHAQASIETAIPSEF